jgi:hypothetical protein
MLAIGKALRYQYEAGAAMEIDLEAVNLFLSVLRKWR